MEQEALHAVLNEILSDREQSAKTGKAIENSLKEINEKMSGLDQRLTAWETSTAQNTSAQNTPALSLEESLSAIRSLQDEVLKNTEKLNVINMNLTLEPRTLVRKFGFIVLPENDHHGTLKFYYSRGLLWVLGCLALLGTVMLIKHAMDGHSSTPSTTSPFSPPSTMIFPNTPPAPVHRPSPHHHSGRTPPVQSLQKDSTGQRATDSFP